MGDDDSGQPQHGNTSPTRGEREGPPPATRTQPASAEVSAPLTSQPELPPQHNDSLLQNGTQSQPLENGNGGSSVTQTPSQRHLGYGDQTASASGTAEARQPTACDPPEKNKSGQSQFGTEMMTLSLAKEPSAPSPGYVEVHGFLQLKDIGGGIPAGVLQAVGDQALGIPKWGPPQPPRYKQDSAGRTGGVAGNPPPGGTLLRRKTKAQTAYGKQSVLPSSASPTVRPLIPTGRPPLPAHPPPALLANRRQTGATPAPPKDSTGPQRPKRSPSVASAVRMTSFERMASERMQALQAEGKASKRPPLPTASRKPKGPGSAKQPSTLQQPEVQTSAAPSQPTPAGQPPPPATKTSSSAVAGRKAPGPGAPPSRGRPIQKSTAPIPKPSLVHPPAGQPVLVTMREEKDDSILVSSIPDRPEEASESGSLTDSDRQPPKGLRRSASSVEIHRWPPDKKAVDHQPPRSPLFSAQQRFLPHRKVQDPISTKDVKKQRELPSLTQRRRATVPTLPVYRKAARSGSSLLSGVSSNISRQRRVTGSATAAATFVAKLLRRQNQRTEPTRSTSERRSSLHFLNKIPAPSRTTKPPPPRGRYANGVPPTTPIPSSPKTSSGLSDVRKKPPTGSEKSLPQRTRDRTSQKTEPRSPPTPGSKPRTISPSPSETDLTATRERQRQSDKAKMKTASPSVSSTSVRERPKRTSSPPHSSSPRRRTRKELPTTPLSVERPVSARSASREARGHVSDFQSPGGIRVRRGLPRSPGVSALQPSRHPGASPASSRGSDNAEKRRTRVPPHPKKATRRARKSSDLQTTDSEHRKALVFSTRATGDESDDDSSPLLRPTRTAAKKEVGRRSRSPQTKQRTSATASSLVSPLLAVQPARVRAASAPKLSSMVKRRPYTPVLPSRSRSKTPSIVQRISKPDILAKTREMIELPRISNGKMMEQERDPSALRLVAEPVALLMSLDQAALHPAPAISHLPCPDDGSDEALRKPDVIKDVATSQDIRRESDTGTAAAAINSQLALQSDEVYAPLPAYFPPDLPPPLSPQPREILPNPSYLRADLYPAAGKVGIFCSTQQQQQQQRQQGKADLYEYDMPICSYAPGGPLSVTTPGFPITPSQQFAARGAGAMAAGLRHQWPSEPSYHATNLIASSLRPQMAVISPPTPFWGAPYIPPQPGREPRVSLKRDGRAREEEASLPTGHDMGTTGARYYTPSRGSRSEDLRGERPTPRIERYHQRRPISTPYCYSLSPCCAPVLSNDRLMENVPASFQGQQDKRQPLCGPHTTNEVRIPRRQRRTRSTSYDSYVDGTSSEVARRTQHRGISNPVRVARPDRQRYATATQRVPPTAAFCCYAPQHSASFGSQSATASHDAPSLASVIDR